MKVTNINKKYRKEMIDMLLPKVEEVDVNSLEFTINNHLDCHGARTRAQTTDIKFRLKTGQYVEIHKE